ncbi:MAG: efflux RND transporter permease subunit, partial [Desulfobacteraceae bacterium]|nr:efflux RND transporter permease subunit [Desulfobacteraceae bacterium]
MSIAKFSVKNNVLVNLLMYALFIFGFISLIQMPRELNPNINFNMVLIIVPYPGAAPGEVENLIVDPIEDEIQDVDNIKEVMSDSNEGFGFVMVRFKDMSQSEFRERLTDIKTEVDKIEFPDEAEDPEIRDFKSGDFLSVISINMSYTIPEDNAQKIADDLEEDVNDIIGTEKVQVSGLAERIISIDVDPVKLNELRVTFDEIIMALKSKNLNMPGGNLTYEKTEYIIRAIGEYVSAKEIEETIVRSSGNGEFIKIKDVANILDTREEMSIISRLNGNNSINFFISKTADANSIDVINEIKGLIEEYRKKVPDGIEFTLTNDNSVYINRTINVLRNNALLGMILIFIVLTFFLGLWNSFLASLGIPISFFITFIIMHYFDLSLSNPSLFALVMVLGIVVDDAIIVIENCHRYRLMGYNSIDSAIYGTSEVVNPIISSIATNIAAFLPLMLLPGFLGKFLSIVPIVFSIALVASMFEAFILLPSHYSHWTVKSKTTEKGEKKFFKYLRKIYTRVLIKSLRKRYIILVTMLVVLGLSVSVIPLIGVEMFGDEDFDQMKVMVRFPEGTSIEENDRIMKKIEAEALKLDNNAVQDVIVNIGLLQVPGEWDVRKNVSQIIFQLVPHERRNISTEELVNRMRKKVSHISGPISLEVEELTNSMPVGKPVSVKVQGKYLDDIKKASLALQDSLKHIKGVYDISDDFPPGKKEIRIIVDEEKAALYGFTTQYVSMNIHYAFEGVEATEYRDGDDEVDVIVQYDKKYRSSIDDVLNLRLTNRIGQTVALRDMVNFEIKRGPTKIKRFDRKRTIFVTGNINKKEISLDKINMRLNEKFPELEDRFPGVTFKIAGQFEEFM